MVCSLSQSVMLMSLNQSDCKGAQIGARVVKGAHCGARMRRRVLGSAWVAQVQSGGGGKCWEENRKLKSLFVLVPFE